MQAGWLDEWLDGWRQNFREREEELRNTGNRKLSH